MYDDVTSLLRHSKTVPLSPEVRKRLIVTNTILFQLITEKSSQHPEMGEAKVVRAFLHERV